MKIFVINLRKNIGRMSKIGALLEAQGLSYEREEAVYGKELSSRQKHKAVSYFKWWCAKGCFPRDGEIGCAMSHQNVYRRLLDSGLAYCCVLEDDADLSPLFQKQLEEVEKWIDGSHPQIVLLTNYTREKEDAWTIRETGGDSSAEAYVITKIAAENILKRNTPICTPSDMWRFWRKKGLFKLYHAFPTVILATWRQPGYISDVCPKGEGKVDITKMTVVGKLFWWASRILGVALGKIFI